MASAHRRKASFSKDALFCLTHNVRHKHLIYETVTWTQEQLLTLPAGGRCSLGRSRAQPGAGAWGQSHLSLSVALTRAASFSNLDADAPCNSRMCSNRFPSSCFLLFMQLPFSLEYYWFWFLRDIVTGWPTLEP